MNGIKVSVQAQVHDATNLALSRAQQLLRSLELLCRRRAKSISDPAPLSHFRAYRQRQKLISSTSSFSEPQRSRPVSPACSPPDFLSFPIALRSMTAVGEPEAQSNIDIRDTPGPSPAESEARKVSHLRSYHFGQTNNDASEEGDNSISQVTQANLEPGKEWKPHNQGGASKARRNSLLGNLRCLQARMNTHREKIGLLLAQFMDDPRLRDKEVRKRESDELTTKSNNHRILVNLIKLDLGINSLAVLLEAPTIDPNLAFFTMAWLAVCQIKELESTTHEVFSDIENNGWFHGQRSSSVQAGIDLSKIGKAVNPQCVRLTTRLEQLGLEAKTPWQPGSMPSACQTCGKES